MANPSASITQNIAHADLSSRFVWSTAVVASPALAAETVIASVLIPTDATLVKGVILNGWAALTVGTSGVSLRFRIRQGSITGSTVADSGLLTAVAANLVQSGVQGIDTAAVLPNQTYVLTLIVGSGAAISTVSAVLLNAIVV